MYDTSKRIDATLLEGSHDIKLSRRELGILLRHMSIMFASIDEPNRNTWYEDDFWTSSDPWQHFKSRLLQVTPRVRSRDYDSVLYACKVCTE